MENGEVVYEDANTKLTLYPDENSDSPREWDNFGKMVCFHKRYDLPHEAQVNSDDYSGWSDMEKHLKEDFDAEVILPIYMYDHSGQSISTHYTYPFNDRWDAGQIGFIYATKADIMKDYKVKKITDKLKKQVAEELDDEVKTYNKWMNGEVVGYVLEERPNWSGFNEKESWTQTNSVWGFYSPADAIADALESLPESKRKQLKNKIKT